MNVRGITGQVIEAGKRTAVILGSQVVTNKVSGMIPFGAGNVAATMAKQATVGIVLSVLAKRFMPKYANDVLVGALLAPLTSLAKTLPVVGPALAGAPPGLGLYVNTSAARRALNGAPPGLGLYVNPKQQTRLNSYVNATGKRAAYYD